MAHARFARIRPLTVAAIIGAHLAAEYDAQGELILSTASNNPEFAGVLDEAAGAIGDRVAVVTHGMVQATAGAAYVKGTTGPLMTNAAGQLIAFVIGAGNVLVAYYEADNAGQLVPSGAGFVFDAFVVGPIIAGA